MSADKKPPKPPVEPPKDETGAEQIEVKKVAPAKPRKPTAKPVPVTTSDGISPPVTAKKAKPEPPAKPEPTKPEPPKPARETVYVDNDDEITAIIDKVEAAKADEVALVLPKRAQVLQSIVNMRLLKRSADEAVKKVVLVTNEAAVIPLAGAAGVSVAKNLQAKPYVPASPIPIQGQAAAAPEDDGPDEKDATLDYHRSMGELAVNEETDEPETIHLAEDAATAGAAAKAADAAKKSDDAVKTPKNKKLKVPNFDRFRMVMILGIVGLIALIVFLILAVKVLPSAVINVQTTGTPVSANFNLTTSDKATALDQTKMVIPATLQSKDQTANQTVQATGQQNNGTKASGTMVFYNCNQSDTLAGTDRTVSAGTVVSANGHSYVTQQAATVPPSHFVGGNCLSDKPSGSVDVVATNGGTGSNQDPATYTVNGYSTISGKGSKMSGGTDNNVTVVAQADIDKAKAAVTSQSSDAFSKDFQSKLDAQGLYVIASTLKISDPQVNATPGLGQPASTVNVSIKINYSVLTVKKDDLKAVVLAQLNKQIDSKTQQILDSDVLKNVVISVQGQTSPTVAQLNVTDSVSATPNIDTNSIEKQATGKKAGDIRDLVSGITGVKSVDVKLSPFWVSKAPAAGKIKVNLSLDKSSSNQKTSNGQQP